jgi:glycosyltransferase involved in cell wall biosynthesis
MTDALFLTTHAWDSPLKVGAHYFAQASLDAGYRLSYVSAPLSLLHVATAHDDLTRLKFKSGNLKRFVPLAVYPLGPLYPFNQDWFFRKRYRLCCRVPKTQNYEFIYVDTPYFADFVRAYEAKKIIFRIPDLLDPNSPDDGAAMHASFEFLIHNADWLIVSSSQIQSFIRQEYGNDSTLIPNGVDCRRFKKTMPVPQEYLSMQTKRAVFVGALEYWVDMKLIRYLAQSLPDVDFVLIGPKTKYLSRIEGVSNVKILGAVDPLELPPYLQHASVGIIPFDVDNHAEFLSGVNPLKVYEYLAAGLPVVSSCFGSMPGLNENVLVANSYEEFSDNVLCCLNSQVDREVMRSSALEYDWGQTLAPYMRFLQDV